jgi:hypothetical protein
VDGLCLLPDRLDAPIFSDRLQRVLTGEIFQQSPKLFQLRGGQNDERDRENRRCRLQELPGRLLLPGGRGPHHVRRGEVFQQRGVDVQQLPQRVPGRLFGLHGHVLLVPPGEVRRKLQPLVVCKLPGRKNDVHGETMWDHVQQVQQLPSRVQMHRWFWTGKVPERGLFVFRGFVVHELPGR